MILLLHTNQASKPFADGYQLAGLKQALLNTH